MTRKHKNVASITVVSLLLIALVISSVFIKETIAETIYTVGTSSAATTVRLAHQHKIFNASGLYWKWYSNGTHAGYRTSSDGSSWSSFNSLGICTLSAYLSVYYNGSTVSYARSDYLLNYGVYRCGTPNGDGTVTWYTDEINVTGTDTGDTGELADSKIIVDSSGYPYITFMNYSSHYPVITKSEYNNGSWSTASGYPIEMNTHSYYFASVVPLSNSRVYVVIVKSYIAAGADYIYGRYYNGTDWEAEEQIGTDKCDYDYYDKFDVISDPNDNIHFIYINNTQDNLVYTTRNETAKVWSTPESIYFNMSYADIACLSYHNSTTQAVFFQGNSTTYKNHIYYKLRLNGIWQDDSEITDWITDGDGLTYYRNMETSSQSYNNQILVCWLTGASDPYTVKFSYLTLESGEAGDSTAPTYSSLSSSTTVAGASCDFNATWTDETGLATTGGYIFETNNTGAFTNETWTAFSSNPQTVSVSKTLSSTVGNVVSWRYHANDTSNNWNSTNLQNITLTDGNTPTFGAITANSTAAGTSVLLSCTVSDNTAVDKVIYSWNNTGSWINQTALSGSGTSYIANHTGTWNSSIGLVISVKVYANDTANNWGTSAQYNFTLTDASIPQFSSHSYSATLAATPCNFNVTVEDDGDLSHYIFSTNNTGSWVNETAVAFISNPQSIGATKTLTASVGAVVQWIWYANDTANNWATSTTQSLTTTAPEPTPTPTPTPTPPPIYYGESTLYMRSDEYTTYNTTGYGLDDTNTNGDVTVSTTSTTLLCGFRVFLLQSTGETELTGGTPIAQITRASAGTGSQNATYSMAARTLHVGAAALLVRMYMYAGSSWTTKAIFVSEVLLTSKIEASTWIFTMYTNLTGTTASVSFGSSSMEGKISGLSFEDPAVFDVGMYYFHTNDWIMFFLYPYTRLIGFGPFASIILFGFGLTVYIRFRNFYFLLLIMVLLSIGGVLNLIMGDALWGFVALLATFALGALYWRVFR